MIPEQLPDVTREDAFFTTYLSGDWHPSFLFLSITVKVVKGQRWPKQCTWEVRSLRQVIGEMRVKLRREPLLKTYKARCARISTSSLISRMLISFWAPVFGLSIKDLCQRLAEENDPLSPLRSAFGLKGPCYPQRVSELHSALKGHKSREEMLIELRDWLVTWLELDRLTEADVEWATRHHTCDQPLLSVGEGYGFDLFLNYLLWQGLFGYLELALLKPLAHNGYQLRDLVIAYCQRLDEVVHTTDDLAAHVRNQLWSRQATERIAPTSQTFINLLLKLGAGRLVLMQDQWVARAHRGKKKLVVAVDACLLELFGDYEGAGYYWDHVTHQTMYGYKLYVIFSVTTQLPIAFYLHQKGDADADVLDYLVQQAKLVLGVHKLGIVLFDKGFWRVDQFKQLTDQQEAIVTPGKQYKTVRQAIATIPRSRWCRSYQPNERWAETQVYFGNSDLRLRLVVRKRLGWRIVRDQQRFVVKDADGNPLKEPIILYHSYLTNLSAIELDTDQVLAMYAQRWGVEDFFEEMQNQYDLRGFPGTSLELVNRHIILTFLLYTLLEGFKKLAADWMKQADFALMELRRFCKSFLRAPLRLLHWLRVGKPSDTAVRAAFSNAGALVHLLCPNAFP